MNAPDEPFNAFDAIRLSRSRDSSQNNIIGNINVSNFRNLILNFIHLLNRTVSSIHSVSWIRFIITIYRLFFLMISPFSKVWEKYDRLEYPFRVISFILVYLRNDVSDVGFTILFAIYAFYLAMLFVLYGTTLYMIKKNKRTSAMIYLTFFSTYLILPLISGSMAYNFVFFIIRFFNDRTIGNFFIFILGLIALIALLTIVFVSNLILGTNPIPELSDPLSVWCPNCYSFAYYESIIIIGFVISSIIEISSVLVNGILHIIFALAFAIPYGCIFCRQFFSIAYFCYEITITMLSAFCVVSVFVGILCFISIAIPYYALIIVWCVLPFLFFIVYRIFVNLRLRSIFNRLEIYTLEVMQTDGSEDHGNNFMTNFSRSRGNNPSPNTNDQLITKAYDQMNVKNALEAIEFIRAACIYNSQCFIDLSLIKWIKEKFPEASFEILHLAFLIPNNENMFQSIFDQYQQLYNSNFVRIAIIYQMVMSLQESSNDLTPVILKEISRQRLAAMKCQQVVSKFWTSCYKSDVSQMSRIALNLQNNVQKIDLKWKHLLSRYPRSHPVLKEYIQFLNGIGCQHGLAENICKLFPSLNEPKEIVNEDDINLGPLQHCIEESVDKRPIKSIRGLHITLGIMITLSIIFVLLSTITAIVTCMYCIRLHNFEKSICNIEVLLGTIGINSYDILDGVNNSRYNLIQESVLLEKNTINFLDVSSFYNLTQFTNFIINMNFSSENWNQQIPLNVEEAAHILSYFAHSLSYTQTNDTIFQELIYNMPEVIDNIVLIGKTTFNEIGQWATFFRKYGFVFHIFVWAILILLIIPMMLVSIKHIKAEMSYLFAFYINIPHSMLAKFAEGVVGVSCGKTNDRKSQLMRLSTSFVQSRNETNEDNDNQQGNNVADGFKIIVGDAVNRASVIPKNFAFKYGIIIGLTTAFFAIIFTVSLELFRSFVTNFLDCLYTERIACERLASLAISSIIASDFSRGFPENKMLEMLELAIRDHMALLSNSIEYNISKFAVSQDEQQQLLFNERCENQTQLDCRSFSQLFDYFSDQLSQAINMINNGELTNETDENSTLFHIRRIFIDQLHPMLEESYFLFVDYTDYQLRLQSIIQIVFLVGSIIALLIFLAFIIIPISKEINFTLYSVKLPMKLIHPLDIVEVPRLVQYLQGECDWSNNKGSSDKGTEKHITDLLFNVLDTPLGVFGPDLSLLLANDEFYGLLHTSREACVGLPMSEIFSSVIPFERDETHPFNALLATVSQLQRGTSPVNVFEVNCDLQIQGKSRLPVLIRLVGINESQNNNNNNEAVLADHFVIFITDLKPKKILEEKMKFESELATKMIETTVPRVLYQIIQNNEGQNVHTFENIPIVMFVIKHDSIINDTDDTAIKFYSNIMKSVHESNQVFAAMCRLMYRPPVWLYASGISVGSGDPAFCISEACLFALNIIDKFNDIEHDMFSLSIAVHYGTLTVISIPLELPVIEIIGNDFQILKEVLEVSEPGTLVGTSQMAEVVSNNQTGIVAVQLGKVNNHFGKPIILYQFTKEEEEIIE